MSGIKSLKEIVESLAESDYRGKDGHIRGNEDFRLLAEIAGVKLSPTLEEVAQNLSSAFSKAGYSISELIKLPQQQRDEIVERAKRDIKVLVDRGKDASLYNDTQDGNETYRRHFYAVEFHVNKEKRTVVALIRHRTWFNRGGVLGKIKHRGIAKCAPQDCFNVHIGKAIALRRALGLEVPSEYLNAPQPTEVRVGDKVGMDSEYVAGKEYRLYVDNEAVADFIEKEIRKGKGRIIDDSREGAMINV